MSDRSSLHAVLGRAQETSAEFPYLLANHVPMILVALDRLGATPARLDEWYEAYRDRHALHAMPASVAAIEPRAWSEHLGDRSRERDYRAFFVGEVGRVGISAAIATYLPSLIAGMGSSAMHPLMRLAYGILSNNPAEVGHALGYWAATYLPLPSPGASAPDTDDPAEVLAGIARIEGIRDYTVEVDLLWHHIRAVGALPGFAGVIDRLAFGPNTARRMTETSLGLFASTMDFSALHAVTGMHWLRMVVPHLDPQTVSLLYRSFWQVIGALVPKIGFPEIPSSETLRSLRELDAPDWAIIAQAAVSSYDEHDISLTFSAMEEYRAWGGDPLYRVVAARRLRLID